jgi:hypothetical protein
MTSKREQVLEAVLALIVAAVPHATVKRNAAKPSSIGPGGAVFMRDGDPGEPDYDLSPITYYYTHKIPIEIAAFPSGVVSKEAAVDTLMAAIGTAIENDRTLGGLCLFLEPEAPASADIEATGAAAGLWADAAIIATYATSNPLT